VDFPKSVPGVGLVDGKFIDEDPLAATPGSLIPSAWGNSVTLELLKVIQDGGLSPDEDDNTQLSAAIQNLVDEKAVSFATKEEAEEGTDNTKATTALRVFQAIAKVVAQATEGAFGWAKVATQVLVSAGVDDKTIVTPKKLAAALQKQSLTAFTAGGSATALTLTPAPAIDAYSVPQRFRVKFPVASGANPTINVSGVGAKNLKQYDSAGGKVAAIFAADQLSDIEYDGTDFVLIDQLPTTNLVGVRGCAVGLKLVATGLDSVVTVTADQVMVESAANTFQTLRAVGVAPTFAKAGAGGLDVGAANSQAASTCYYIWVIWGETKTKEGLFSLSATWPTLPAGYTHAAIVGWTITDGAGTKFPLGFTKNGRVGQFKVGGNVPQLPRMVYGVQGSPTAPTWVAVSLSPYFSPTVAAVYLSLYSSGAATHTILAPSNSYGAVNASTNTPLVNISNSASNANLNNFLARIVPESGSVYYASNATVSHLSAVGWEDNF